MNYTKIIKIICFGALLPTYVLSSEKFSLVAYPNLTGILGNKEHESEQTKLINQYLEIPTNENGLMFSFSPEQKSKITLGVYLFLHAKTVEQEKDLCIAEAKKSFAMTFPCATAFNMHANTQLNELCQKVEKALWWDYYLQKIPFVVTMFNFFSRVHNLKKSYDF